MNELKLTKDYRIKNPKDLYKEISKCDITLGNLLEIINDFKFKKMSSLLFDCSYEWLEGLLKEAKKDPKENNIHTIELSYNLEITKDFDGKSICSYWHVGGLGPMEEDDEYYDESQKNKDISWAIDFTPINELLNCKIKINEDGNIIYHNHKKIKYKELSLKDFIDKINNKNKIKRYIEIYISKFFKFLFDTFYKKNFYLSNFTQQEKIIAPPLTLKELIYYVLYELTFHGNVSDRNKRYDDLKESVKEIKKRENHE